MEKRDFYEVLGVRRDSSPKDIKTAYRKLAMQFHPDRNPGDADAEAKFKEAAEAYEVLSDPERRKMYDRFGHEGLRGGGGFGSGSFRSVDEIFEQFGDIFGDFFGFGRQSATSHQRGADLRVDLELEFEDAVFGVSKTLTVPRHTECGACDGTGAADGTQRTTCPNCKGRGQVHHAQGFFTLTSTCPTCRGTGSVVENPCEVCHGAGIVEEVREVQVAIPPGVDDGTRLRLRGEGEAGRNGGPRGDLYVFLHVQPSRVFERDGANLHLRAPISFAQAALGGKLEVPTLEGTETIDVPPATQTGEQYVLRGLGIPRVNREGRGNLFVHFFVEVPRKLTKKQRELLQEFARESGVEVDEASVVPPDWKKKKSADEKRNGKPEDNEPAEESAPEDFATDTAPASSSSEVEVTD